MGGWSGSRSPWVVIIQRLNPEHEEEGVRGYNSSKGYRSTGTEFTTAKCVDPKSFFEVGDAIKKPDGSAIYIF
jgi:hypothetical protein